MESSREALIAALAGTQPALARLTGGLEDAALDFRPGAEEWSAREILAHLVDDEQYVMRTRLERMMKEERPHLAPHDERHWFATRNRSRDALAELLADFAVQRAASLGIVRMLRESDWAREGYQPEYGVFTAEGWLARWVQHDATHLRQIEANLAAYRAEPR
jgi:hypothetical protein